MSAEPVVVPVKVDVMHLKRLLVAGLVYGTTFLTHRHYLARYRKAVGDIHTTDDAKVTSKLWTDLKLMTRIALPTVKSKEGLGSFLFIMLFLVRSALRVISSNCDGDVLDAMQTKGDGRNAAITRALVSFGAVEMLFASASGTIEHIRFWLISSYRARLTTYFHKRLFDKLLFYHTIVLDDRIENAEVYITSFCAEFAEHFAELPYYFVLPLVEAAAALATIAHRHGTRSASFMVVVVVASLFGMKHFSPQFGKIHASILKREEDFRRMHNDVTTNAEQIALQRGADFTRNRLDDQFGKLRLALNQMGLAKGHFELLEQSLESLWALGAYVASVFSAQSERPGVNTILSSIVVELRLINNFNKFMRDFVVNFRELSHLSEFTTSLADFERTLDSIVRGHYFRIRQRQSCSIDSVDSSPMMNGSFDGCAASFRELSMTSPFAAVRTRLRSAGCGDDGVFPVVTFNQVDIVNPKDVLLVSRLNVTFQSNEDWAIVGDNARGKSSVLRIIAGLWGPANGFVELDESTRFFFLPQQAYMLSNSTLVEQICFPDAPEYSASNNHTISPTTGGRRMIIANVDVLKDALQAATAISIVENLGGWGSGRVGFEEGRLDRSYDWSTLSGGEKQKIAAARLFYHAALASSHYLRCVAVLDESTSQMDSESEPRLYENLRSRNIRLISVTHRPSLLAYHTHALHLGHTPDSWRVEQSPTSIS